MLSRLGRSGYQAWSCQVRPVTRTAFEPFASAPKSEDPISPTYNVEQSKLKSGATVLSICDTSPYQTMSLYAKAGSRFQKPWNLGATHFLKHLAFKGNNSKRGLPFIRDLEHIGTDFHCDISRETIGYHLRGLRADQPLTLDVQCETLATVAKPKFEEYELRTIRPIIASELEAIKRDPVTSLDEILHAVAFKDAGLGHPLFTPEESLGSISPNDIHDHVLRTSNLRKDLVFVTQGIDHKTVVSKLNGFFDTPATPYNNADVKELDTTRFETSDNPNAGERSFPDETDVWRGGSIMTFPSYSHTHLVVGYSAPSMASADRGVAAVIAEALGGGGISKAGPGDAGHTSRLATNLVGKNESVISAATTYNSYYDNGLLYVRIEAEPSNASSVVQTVKGEVEALASKGLSEEELAIAKSRCIGRNLRRIDDDPFERINDVAQSGLWSTVEPQSLTEQVVSVTAEDVKRVAARMVERIPNVVCVGDCVGL